MEKILEYILLNYTWFLFGAIIILLAIIGRYADKTNFGQGQIKETQEKTKEENLELQKDITFKDYVNQNKEIKKAEEKETLESNGSNGVVQDSLNQQIIDNLNLQNQNVIDSNLNTSNNLLDLKSQQDKIFEESFEKFDKEFDLILPKKQVIDTDLLEDIDSLSLDNTQKISITDIPDLDDVDLPEIKKLKPDQEDVWKF